MEGKYARLRVILVIAAVVSGLIFGLLQESALGQDRTVAVVYDNSGSMLQGERDRWWYANYALQTLSAVLAEKDELYGVTMEYPEEARLLESNRSSTLEEIRSGYAARNQRSTPYTSVQTAMNALRQGGGESKWLVVLTDGTFKQPVPPPRSELDPEIRRFIEETGSRALFLVIGESRGDIADLTEQRAVRAWESVAQAQVFQATGRSEVIRQMQRIGAAITSRTLSTGGPAISVDGSRLQIESEFPLSRMTVVQQADVPPEQLPGIRSARAGTGPIGEISDLEIAMPETSSVQLSARVTHLRQSGDEVIPAGSITAEFAEPVSISELTVLPEVAAALDVQLLDESGTPIPTSSQPVEVCRGDTFRIRAALLSPDGDTLTQAVNRPEDLSISAELGDQTYDLSQGPQATFYQASVSTTSQGELPLSVRATYPGYFNYQSPVYVLTPTVCDPPRDLSLRASGPWNGTVLEVEGGKPRRLQPLADGEPIGPEEFEDWSLSLENDSNLRVELTRSDSVWLYEPAQTWGLAQLTPTGNFEMAVVARSGQEDEEPARADVVMQVREADFWSLWGPPLLLLLLLLLLGWWLMRIMNKRRFCRGAKIEHLSYRPPDERPRDENPLPHSLDDGWFDRWVNPSSAQTKVVEGVTFRAGASCSYVEIPREALTDNMWVDGENVNREEEQGPPPTLHPGSALEIRRGPHHRRDRFTYNRS